MSYLLDNHVLFTNANQTSAFDFVYDAQNADGLAFQTTYSQVASGTGVLTLQQSVDKITWFDVSGDTVTINTTGSVLWTTSPATTNFYRLHYTATSGGTNFSTTVMSRIFGTGS